MGLLKVILVCMVIILLSAVSVTIRGEGLTRTLGMVNIALAAIAIILTILAIHVTRRRK